MLGKVKQFLASHAGQQVARFVRLVVVALGASQVVPSLVNGTLNRGALTAAVVAAVEVAVRQMYPTLPANFTDPARAPQVYEHIVALIRDELRAFPLHRVVVPVPGEGSGTPSAAAVDTPPVVVAPVPVQAQPVEVTTVTEPAPAAPPEPAAPPVA